MQYVHAIFRLTANWLVTLTGKYRLGSWAVWAILTSFTCAVATIFRSVWARDLHRVKESFIRRIDAATKAVEAEARIKEAEADKKTAEALTVAAKIDDRSLRRAKRVFK